MYDILKEQLNKLGQNTNGNLIVFIIFQNVVFPSNNLFKYIKKSIDKSLNCNAIIFSDYTDYCSSNIIIGSSNMRLKNLRMLPYDNIVFIYGRVASINKEGDVAIDIHSYENKIFQKSEPVYLIRKILNSRLEAKEIKIRLAILKNLFINDEKIRDYDIDNDLKVLINEKKLTTRLAKIIYKSSTFNFKINNRLIGDYYRGQLDIKSATKRIPIYILKKNDKTIRKEPLKVYDLNKSPLFKDLLQVATNPYTKVWLKVWLTKP